MSEHRDLEISNALWLIRLFLVVVIAELLAVCVLLWKVYDAVKV